MFLKALYAPYKVGLTKTLRIMKLTAVILLSACLTASANGHSQNVTLTLKDAPLEKVFTEIRKQTGYDFVYKTNVLEQARKVNVSVQNASLQQVLDLCFKGQPLTYKIFQNFIAVKSKDDPTNGKENLPPPPIDVRGRVVNENGEPVAGASVKIKGTNIGTSTNENGEFTLNVPDPNMVLIITSVNIETLEIRINARTDLANISVKTAVKSLDETIVQAYGTTTRRLSTGNISKVSGEEISKQPVSNPLLALQGRIPGLNITQSSGLNGAAVKVQLRGQSSIIQGSEPLYIIDGIPYTAGNIRLNQIANSTDEIGMSPFNLIDPNNIQSIEVLKDADATAIYGSRGASGVILITTKKGIPGKTNFNVNINTGISKVTRTMKMLNTSEYIQMRREAFLNDGLLPSADPFDPGYAPDIMVWDSTRYTDLKKLLIGGTAKTTDIRISLFGGNQNTQFLIGAGYQKQSTVFPTDLGDIKISSHFSLTHLSTNKNLTIQLSGSYLADENKLNVVDLTSFINLPPNIKLYDDQGKLNWQENGVLFNDVLFRQNPIAILNAVYNGKFKNLISNLQINYKVVKDLTARISLGYNSIQGIEKSAEPSTSIDPSSGNLPSANFSNRSQSSWIVEPQLEYVKSGKVGTLTTLFGTTWQENKSEGLSLQGFNYASDIALGSISGAGIARASNRFSQYRYTALFGRVTYNFDDRYILNISGRRDGSSRFGPNMRFSNFGAVGGAWILSSETFFEKYRKLFSFVKIRASYGVTGNDQIGDYNYLDTWTTVSNTYQGIPVTNPSALFNPDFSWERNKKLEFGLDLGLFKNRILFAAAFYQNKSNNQLINYTLPIQTGFTSVLKNMDALLQNSGIECQVTTRNIVSKNFSWTTSLNLSANRNKLLSFPGLATSSYSNTYFEGYAVTTRRLFNYMGTDPSTGLYQFEDVDRNGILDKNDRVNYKSIDPKYFGGISNTLQFKQFLVDVFFEFKKQQGYDYLSNNSSVYTPGYGLVNHPVLVLNRWQNLGDVTNIQKFTATSSSVAFDNMNSYLPSSDANISEASFIRCKNISASYELPSKLANKIGLLKCMIYARGQNLFTVTKYKGADPETQNMFVLPPLKTIVLGLQLTF